MPDFAITLLLFATGILAGISNAVAGGGTFFTFPAFLGAGLPPIVAGASNAIAVWPGHAFAAAGYRRELRSLCRGRAGSMVIALTGGAAGALLLAYVGNAAFSRLIPILILLATLLFAVGSPADNWLKRRTAGGAADGAGVLARAFEFAFAVYGGFFGAGLGIMLMAGLSLAGVSDIQANNALKNLLATAITSTAVVLFAVAGIVSWPHAAAAFAGAIPGGLLGARIARILPAIWLRRIVVAVGALLSVHYFREYYGV